MYIYIYIYIYICIYIYIYRVLQRLLVGKVLCEVEFMQLKFLPPDYSGFEVEDKISRNNNVFVGVVWEAGGTVWA